MPHLLYVQYGDMIILVFYVSRLLLIANVDLQRDWDEIRKQRAILAVAYERFRNNIT